MDGIKHKHVAYTLVFLPSLLDYIQLTIMTKQFKTFFRKFYIQEKCLGLQHTHLIFNQCTWERFWTLERGGRGGGVAEEFGKLISENSDKTAGFMLAGINIFWARLILAWATRQGLKWALRRAQNTLMPKNINYLLFTILEGFEKIKTAKTDNKGSLNHITQAFTCRFYFCPKLAINYNIVPFEFLNII